MHLDDERLVLLLDAAASPEGDDSERAHLAGCAPCRERLARAQREQDEVEALLCALDAPPSGVRVEAIIARAAEAPPTAVPLPMVAPARRARPPRVFLRWAAGLAIALGVVAVAAALPGSPLRGWLAAWRDHSGAPAGERSIAPLRSPAMPPGPSGIALRPGAHLVIDFPALAPGSVARVWLTDGEEVEVRAPSGSASFGSEADRLLVRTYGAAVSFEIDIPRGAPRVEIRVGSDVVFSKVGEAVTPAREGPVGGPIRLLLSPPAR